MEKVLRSRKIIILYGSQTGTAQEVAERIWREAKRYHFHGPVKPMDDYDITRLIYEPLLVFVCATTGQGEEPDNMKHFWKFLLRKNLPLDSLSGVKYAVLGLGDSSYVKFNYAAKKLNRRLMQLGGECFLDIGLADDQHDLGADAVIDPWINSLWQKLSAMYPLPEGVEPLNERTLFLPRWLVARSDEDASTTGIVGETKACKEFSETSPYSATVLRNIRTTSPSHFQDVRLLRLKAPELDYKPGDVVLVSPQNSQKNVEKFFSLVGSNGYSPETVIKISEKDSDAPVPSRLRKPVTLRMCAEQYWDLNMVPRRHFFHLLSFFTTSELEREKLIEFTTAEGQEELYNYCNRPRRTVLEVLQDFPHATASIPLDCMFELLQPIRPRAFSIASSPRAHKGEIHILVTVVEYRTKLQAPRLGLCSTWLASLPEGAQVPVWIRKGSFVFPQHDRVPVIMIGPGTGVAPFRSYVHERVSLNQASNKLLHLFFGCRNKAADFHCKEEWLELEAAGQLSLFCAFSRDQEDKVYVQNVIKKHADLVWTLLSSGAAVYVAGSSKNMPSGVREAFIHVSTAGNLTEVEAEQYVSTLENTGRYQTETWS